MPKMDGMRKLVEGMRIAAIASVCLLCMFAATRVLALDSNLILTQYGHSAWRMQDGVIAGAVTSLAQTKDGYLWVGTRAGLLRFNGVELVPFKPPSGEPVRSAKILSLLGARDGSLWIGTGNDVEHWRASLLTHYPPDVGYILSNVLDIQETRDGEVWIARSRIPAGEGALCRVVSPKLECFGVTEGMPLPYVMDILETKEGTLLIHSDDQVVEWNRKTSHGEILKTIEAGADGVQTLAFDSDGSLLIGSVAAAGGHGLSVLKDGRLEALQIPKFDGRLIPVQTIYVDSTKNLWIGTQGRGLYRIAGRRVEHYGSIDGLSSDSINKILEDREGNIWVATQEGLDRFRDVKVATFSVHEGLSDDQVNGVVAARDGSVWISNAHSLDVLRGSSVTSYRSGKELPGEQVTSIFEDRRGGMWVGIDKKLTLFDRGKFRIVGGADKSFKGPFTAIMDDPEGNLWLISTAGLHGGLFRLEGETIREAITFDQLPIAKAHAIASDAQSGVWLPLVNGDLAHWHDGHADLVAFHHASHTGNLTGLISAADGFIYSSSALGVISLRGDKWQLLDQRNGLPCSSVRTMLSDAERLWLYADCGLLSISFTELDRWWREPSAVLKVQLLDSFDGAQPASSGWSPNASRSPDGRLWFANESVLQLMDPARSGNNRIPPLVQIEKIVADDTTLSATTPLLLRPRTRNLEFDYTSSSFSVPQKAQFRYQLDGYDKDWQEAGRRRQAFYTGLPPGRYVFRVTASNSDGIWAAADASIHVDVMPAFFQTRWFIALCVLLAAASVWFVYLARIRQITAGIRIRAEERVKEREQIARDLHDTMLQGVQGLIYQFQAATERLPSTEPVRAILEESLDRADGLIAQGRESVSGLRGAIPELLSLEDALNLVAADLGKRSGMSFHPSVQGVTRSLRPMAREELFRIGSEALVNAFMHSRAGRIDMEIVYDPAYVQLAVRDDGSGFDVDSWNAGARQGHFGLMGMQERARQLNTRINIRSSPGAGTEISVKVAIDKADMSPVTRGIRGWLAAKIRAARST